ncbi:hypothetical protein ACOMHN_045219 [Nucella lapillus]
MPKRRKPVEEGRGGGAEGKTEVDTAGGVTLIRSLGLVGGASIIMGSMIGALSYAELGTLMGKSGGEYQYLREAFGNGVAFLFAWTFALVTQPTKLAIITLTFAEYAVSILATCGTPRIPVKLIAALVLVTLAVVNSYSTRLAARVQIVFTMAKLGALAVIIVGGLVRVAQGHTAVLETGFEGSIENPATVSLAFYSALWAYDSWGSLNFVVEELQEPEKNLKRASVIGVVVVTTVYTLTNVSYYTVLSTDQLLSAPAVAELLSAPAVAEAWGEVVLRGSSLLIPLSVMVSTFGSANGATFIAVRVLFAAGRQGDLPDVMSYVHCANYTPVPSLIFTVVLSLLMIIPGDIGSLVVFFSFATWLFRSLTFIALLMFRVTTRWKNAHRVYKVPLVIPTIMVAVSIYLVVAPIVDSPRVEFLYALLFILGGLAFYVPFVLCKVPAACYDQICTSIQLLLQVVPSKKDD